MESKKKVSAVEAMLMVGTSLLMDLIEFLLGLVIVGEITNTITNFFDTAIFGFWFTMKGIKLPTFLIGSALEFIPIINVLPIRTATVIITIMIANNPKLSKISKLASGKPNVK